MIVKTVQIDGYYAGILMGRLAFNVTMRTYDDGISVITYRYNQGASERVERVKASMFYADFVRVSIDKMILDVNKYTKVYNALQKINPDYNDEQKFINDKIVYIHAWLNRTNENFNENTFIEIEDKDSLRKYNPYYEKPNPHDLFYHEMNDPLHYEIECAVDP